MSAVDPTDDDIDDVKPEADEREEGDDDGDDDDDGKDAPPSARAGGYREPAPRGPRFEGPYPWHRKRGLQIIAAGGVLLVVYARFVFPVTSKMKPWFSLFGTELLPVPKFGEIGCAVVKALLGAIVLGILGVEALTKWHNKRIASKIASIEIAARIAPYGKPKNIQWGLMVCALVAAVGYFDFGDLGYTDFYHRWDIFHYYVGSKYAPELGYEKLYACTAVAQSEISPKEKESISKRKWRDLVHDEIKEGSLTLLPENVDRCHALFTPTRWESFRNDVAFFRSTCNQKFWDDMQVDHGYNPPPLWTMIGGTIARLVPVSEANMKDIACIDLLLFTGLFAAVYWAFGGRVTAIAIIYWGTQFAANMFFTGGAFLRQDWIFFLVFAACLARRRKFGWAGASLAVSGLLRVFPMLFAAGWIVGLVGHFIDTRKIWRPGFRALAGMAIAVAVLVPVSAVVAGPGSYPGFVSHIRTHNDTPLTNHMGLKTLVSFSTKGRMRVSRNNKLTDPFEKWKELRRSTFKSRIWAYGAAALGSFLAIVFATRKRKNVWISMAVGVLAVTAFTELTNYYYSFFLAAIPLARVHKSFERGLVLLGALSSFLLPWKLSFYWDDRFEAQSLIFFVGATLLAIGLFPQPKSEAPAPAPADADGTTKVKPAS